jgi:uncharacterized protein with FMN-binding domain
MPDTRLILHVKGTESEIAELPKEKVRAAISQGKITHSQLIWRPDENMWKPVRELPELLPVERLILHVKGTESETAELPKEKVRVALSQGRITHSQLIWRPEENAWKQVRELPDLFPSQQVAPSPVPVAGAPALVAPDPVIPESPTSPVARAVAASGNVPQVRIASAAKATPQVKVAVASNAAAPQVRAAASPKVASKGGTASPAPILVRTTGELEVKNEEESHPLKWVCIGLGALILLVLGANYFLVDQPLAANMAQTSYASSPVYGHLAAFVQPNVLVIHIPHTATLTPENLTKFLVALAGSTPVSPISHELFARVALTSSWTAQYSFSGYSWKQLAEMGRDGEAARQEFLMDQMGDAGGESLLPESTLNQASQQATRDKVWSDFVAHFTTQP